jgi:hypothetical protein
MREVHLQRPGRVQPGKHYFPPPAKGSEVWLTNKKEKERQEAIYKLRMAEDKAVHAVPLPPGPGHTAQKPTSNNGQQAERQADALPLPDKASKPVKTERSAVQQTSTQSSSNNVAAKTIPKPMKTASPDVIDVDDDKDLGVFARPYAILSELT